MNVQEIPDDWIMILTAMVKETKHLIECHNVDKKRKEIALPIRQERKRRGLRKISVFDDIEERPVFEDLSNRPSPKPLPPGFDLSVMDDQEVKLWYAIAEALTDYSLLGWGIRSYLHGIWNATVDELKRRKIKLEDLFEMKW